MSKMLHEYFFDMQLFKNSEFGCVENQYLQLKINGCCMLCLKEIGEMSYLEFKQNLKNCYFWSKIVFL